MRGGVFDFVAPLPGEPEFAGDACRVADRVEEERDFFGHRGAVRNQRVDIGPAPRSHRQHASVVAERTRGACLRAGLLGTTGKAGDHQHRSFAELPHRVGCEFEHRPIQAHVADGELGRVNADGQPTRAGVDMIEPAASCDHVVPDPAAQRSARGGTGQAEGAGRVRALRYACR